MHNFGELKTWNRGIDLVVDVYTLINSLPGEEKLGLTSQIRRAAVSISSNIAERCGRNSDKESAQFLNVAQGSSNEVETQLIIAERLKFITKKQSDQVINELHKNQKMTRKFIDKLRSNY